MNQASPDGMSNVIKKWLPLAILLCLLGLSFAFGIHEQLSLSNLIKHRASIGEFVSSHFLAAISIYMLIYIAAVAMSFPGASALTLISGFIFGGLLGGFVTVISATIGAAIIFLIARSSFGEFLKDKAGAFLNKMIDGFKRNAFQYLLTLRLTPLFPFWVVNIVPALLGVKLSTYALATFIGIIPATFVFTYIGSGLDSIIAAQEAANPGCADSGTCSIEIGALVTPEIVLALGGLALLSVTPIVIKAIRNRK